jgi:hypothetical protein
MVVHRISCGWRRPLVSTVDRKVVLWIESSTPFRSTVLPLKLTHHYHRLNRPTRRSHRYADPNDAVPEVDCASADALACVEQCAKCLPCSDEAFAEVRSFCCVLHFSPRGIFSPCEIEYNYFPHRAMLTNLLLCRLLSIVVPRHCSALE